MSKNLVDVSLRHAARNAQRGFNSTLYSNGSTLLLVMDTEVKGTKIRGQVFERTASSSALARAVVERFYRDWHTFPHLSPGGALSASIAYAEAAWRTANRRMGRRAQ